MNVFFSSARSASVRRLIGRHPYISAFSLIILFLLVARLFGFILGWLHLPFIAENLLGESLLAIVIAIFITLAGWWSESGFTRGFDRHTLLICLGAILLIGLPLLASLHSIIGKGPLSLTVITILLVLLIGFVEEGLFRGLLGCILLPRGIFLYVALSSMLFMAAHITNLLAGFPLPYVIGQMLLALGSGTLFAAIRLRTGSIWPTILLHALRDFSGLFLLAINPKQTLSVSLNLTIIVGSIYCLLFMLNTAILLRPRKLRQLRVKYNLIPQTPVLPENGEQTIHQLPYDGSML